MRSTDPFGHSFTAWLVAHAAVHGRMYSTSIFSPRQSPPRQSSPSSIRSGTPPKSSSRCGTAMEDSTAEPRVQSRTPTAAGVRLRRTDDPETPLRDCPSGRQENRLARADPWPQRQPFLASISDRRGMHRLVDSMSLDILETPLKPAIWPAAGTSTEASSVSSLSAQSASLLAALLALAKLPRPSALDPAADSTAVAVWVRQTTAYAQGIVGVAMPLLPVYVLPAGSVYSTASRPGPPAPITPRS